MNLINEQGPPHTHFLNYYNHVSLFYWKPTSGGLNFGDHLSSVIVTKILADQCFLLEEETDLNKRLLAIGSILHFAKDNDVIWGTGVNGKIDPRFHAFTQLDVRAVRGPLTRNFLKEKGISAPEIFGDPALLLPLLFPGRFAKNTKRKYVVVPNLNDLAIVSENKLKNIVSPLMSWNRCISEILEAELVIASSLHALIVAEVYGVPARYIRLSEQENLFKYNDYMLGTGRKEIEFARTIEEAIEMGGMPPLHFNHAPLLKAFPIDLWKREER
jgi:pyruvyltransferase